MQFVEIAVFLPIRRTFVYEVPEEMRTAVVPGKGVWIPFGRRFLPGFVLGAAGVLPPHKAILPIRELLPEDFSLAEKYLQFLLWVARYYFQPIGEVLKCALPTGLRLHQRETFLLTLKGRKFLETLSAPSPEKKFLKSLERRGERVLSFSLRRGRSAGLERQTIERMVDEGLIEKKDDSWHPPWPRRMKTFVRFLSVNADVPLSPRQEEALCIIQEAGEIAVSELKEKYNFSSAILLNLEKNQFVKIIKKEEPPPLPRAAIEGEAEVPPSILSAEQNQAIAEISQAVDTEKFHPFLLHGVTGSGKTEVYLRVIERVMAQGRQALLLVPEIALTAQLLAYFRSRIDSPLAVWHSGLSPGERYEEWRRMKRGSVKLVIGARSAIFAPLDRLGILIVDEEHDPSYKQEEKVRYHARDLALVRGKMEKAVVVLGSATPSMESYHNVSEKKFRYLVLAHRVEQRPLPEIQVVDMREEQKEGKERFIFSRALEEALQQNTIRGEQALLFLNRRGFSSFALCRECGFVYKCPNCSVSLNYHLANKAYHCHYCNFAVPALSRCPRCASFHLLLFGLGTQRLEQEIKKKLPQVQVARLDRDTTTRKNSHSRILNQLRQGEVSLLIGTQMITKGHDFPRVTLVGVLAADLSLNLPDFRSSERTYQLLTQVAGRAGRGLLPGKVIIQTYNPNQYTLQMVRNQDFQAFYQQEAQYRKELGYPPFTRLINLRMEGNSPARTLNLAKAIEKLMAGILLREKKFTGVLEVLGPAPAPLSRLRGKSRYQILLKGKRWSVLHDFTEKVLTQAEQEISFAGVNLTVDVDPVNML